MGFLKIDGRYSTHLKTPLIDIANKKVSWKNVGVSILSGLSSNTFKDRHTNSFLLGNMILQGCMNWTTRGHSPP